VSLNYSEILNYSDHSIGSGSLRIDEIIDNPINQQNGFVGLTDEATVIGVPEFVKKCLKKKIKPVVGTTISVAYKGEDVGKLTLLAKNNNGYENICKILSTIGEYHNTKKSVVDLETILENSKDIFIVDGAKQSILDKNKKNIEKYKEIFKKLKYFCGENILFTIQSSKNQYLNKLIYNIVNKTSDAKIRVFASNNNRYSKKEDRSLFLNRVLEYSHFKDTKDISLITDEYSSDDHIHSADEIKSSKSTLMKAFADKGILMSSSDLKNEIETIIFPDEPSIEKVVNHDLRDITRKKWAIKKESVPKNEQKIYINRLKKELKVIEANNFDDYFTATHDMVANYRSIGEKSTIRGSAGGSLVLHMLGISLVDPIKHGLLFERFLQDRDGIPDVDIDVSSVDKMLKQMKINYPDMNMARLMAFDTIKSAYIGTSFVIESERKFGLNKDDTTYINELDKVEKKIKELEKYKNKNNTDKNMLSYLLETNHFWKKEYSSSPIFKNVCDLSLSIEGLKINKGLNPGSMVFSKTPFQKTASTVSGKDADNMELVQLDKHQDFYAKFDVLANLSLARIIDIEKSLKNNGIILDTDDITTYDNEKAYEFISKGHTIGLHQLNGNIGTLLSKDIKPKSFTDIIAISALIRAGHSAKYKSSEFKLFLQGKENESSINYKHELLKPILQETYGSILYEEQIMNIVTEISGLTSNDADKIRSAIKKNKKEVMDNYKPLFIKGALKKGILPEVSGQIYADIEAKFTQFVFNKSHATSYMDLAYKLMHLKMNYPAEFINAHKNVVKTEDLVEELIDMGIAFKRPSINESEFDSRTSKAHGKNKIYTTVLPSAESAFNNVSNYKKILMERDTFDTYKDIYEYTSRVLPLYLGNNVFAPNLEQLKIDEFKTETRNLIKIGALDSLAPSEIIQNIPLSRAFLNENIDKIVDFVLNPNSSNELNVNIPETYPNLDDIIKDEQSFLGFSPCSINRGQIEKGIKSKNKQSIK
jgi:DNA polymerase-3 subunit alpha